MTLDSNWFTEVCKEGGSAFSLRIKSKLHQEQTAFQKIEILDTEQFGHLMVIDGFIMLSERDNFIYHEMMSHPAIFTHPAPRDIVIIGGGDCGTLREVLRHDAIQSVTQIEIDRRVTELSAQFFPQLCEANDDPRASICFEDGIQWMKDTTSASQDIIIIDSTDPIGPAKGLFTKSFYAECARVLRTDGIVIQQSESPLFHMDILRPMRQAMHNAGLKQSQTLHFFQCVYPSGWWTCTMASKNRSLLNLRQQDIERRTFQTRYYNADIHRAAMVAPEFVRQQLAL